MFTPQPKLRSLVAATRIAIALPLVMSSAYAFDSGSTGVDGALNPTVNTVIQLPPSGVLNYTSVNIPAGVTVKFQKNALNTPVYMLVSGNATITGSIDIAGGDSPAVGTAGDGLQGDDGVPGVGGPGGFDGGRGGKTSAAGSVADTRGGAGLGPGGGAGGYWGANGVNGTEPDPYTSVGGSARHADKAYSGTNYGAGIGEMYGSSALMPLIGGSGGGGAAGGRNYEGSGGAGGGGAILLAVSGTLLLNSAGRIYAHGGSSGKYAGTYSGTYGGGGSGGAIRIIASTFSGSGILYARYGCQYYTQWESSCADTTRHGGGYGRVRIEADTLTYTGTTYPAYSTDKPGPISLSNMPALRIATIGGQAVPTNPTGVADVVFPAELVNPVTVELATTNVPTGNTVKVKVIPAYGVTSEVLSPAITGTTAAGTTSVQVTLPQGPSTLQATTTYTIVVAMGEALSVFAKNERVEKVQLIATLGGAGRARLITISGKEYEVPMSVLQQVGFAG